MSAIEVVPYNPAWPALFEEERRRIEAALGGWVQGSIEHVGSTSVPGLAAKPVIDIMVGVANLEEARGAFDDVASLGYLYAPYKSDFMHWFCKPSEAVRTHHLYLMEPGHPEWEAHIAFRDHLRTHPETAAAPNDFETIARPTRKPRPTSSPEWSRPPSAVQEHRRS
jgi:GrpB-like predicted nucleotidyltransferase (UPF0157 family)